MVIRPLGALPLITTAAAALLLCAGCGPANCPPQTAPPSGAEPPTAAPPAPEAPVAPAAPIAGPGRLDPELAKLATSAKGVHKIKLRFDAQGNVQKLAIYHRDEGQVPVELGKLVEEQFPGATVRFYEGEHYADLGRVHEAKVKTKDGRNCEVSRSAAGKLLYTECEIAVAAVPEPVSKAIAAALPAGKIVGAEQKDWADGRKRCHVKVEVDPVVHYLVVELGGTIVEHYLRVPASVDIPVPTGQ